MVATSGVVGAVEAAEAVTAEEEVIVLTQAALVARVDNRTSIVPF